MPEIKVLPEDVVSKIAAGEVIERPASVLKELIENSLDAGASKIEIEIRKAGRGLIRVHDDGRGMDREDLRLSLGRHATSKLNVFEDIYSLATFGFRGEALYSIFAVSRLKITSFRAGAESGYAIEGEGGRVIAELPAPPVKGTTIEAADLFFNTPARAKFMKSDASERAQLIKTVEEAALANLGVSFRLVIDGAEILSLPTLPGGLWENLKSRSASIFGKSTYGGMARVEGKTTGMAVYGFASRPDALCATRVNQHFFVNRRPVSSALLRQAFYRGYGHMLSGRHPACAIFVELDPGSFDANIHPQKRDVKFSGENEIFKTISNTIYEELLSKQTAAVNMTAPAGEVKFGSPDVPAYREAAAPPQAAAGPGSVQDRTGQYNSSLPPLSGNGTGGLFDQHAAAAPQPAVPADWRGHELKYLGQLAKSYLLFECEAGLLVVDQHAAQERVLFEKYLDEFSKGAVRVQPLLVPLETELSRSQMETVLKWRDWLKTAGFEIDQRGPAVALLRATPALFYFTQPAFSEFLGYLSEVLGEPEKAAEDMKRGIIATMACKKSIKAHDFVKPQEAMRLMEDLKKAKDGYHCPHGRPTLFHLSGSDIARRFQRSAAL
ncbi:MAG: DNA mismatch repair endonuclease MutL [Elusimicrobiales bacterium]|nr:DNA mismatch repair endonuclease MutL [Elusimicrobiales bacterium]